MNRHHPADHDSADARMALFDFAFDHAPIGIALVDTRGCIIRANAAFATLIDLSVTELAGKPFADFTHPDDLKADWDLFQETLAGQRNGYTIEKRYVLSDGRIVHVVIHVVAMRNATGRVVRFITQIVDVTLQKQHEQELAERAAQLELAMEAVRGGFWHMDVATQTFETSDRLAHFIGGPEAAKLDLRTYSGKINPEDEVAADLTPLLAGTVDQSVAEYRLDTASGERWMRCDRRLIRDKDGRPTRIVGMVIDFTDERRRIESSERNSETDALTGLLNRRGLARRFGDITSADGFSLLAIDLDGFKEVNDAHGHAGGDAVLIETALRLTALIRKSDLVARTGGDEFVIVVTGDAAAGEAIGERIVEAMRAPVPLTEARAQVRASVGGVWTADKVDIATLIAIADERLYQAKADGKDGWRFAADRRA